MTFKITKIELLHELETCTQSYCKDKSKYRITLEVRHSTVINRQWWVLYSCERDIGDYLILPDYLNMDYFDKLPLKLISHLLRDVKQSRYTIKQLEKFREDTE